jgi:uncharacterized glyoxalase superfamily protein PhnB
MSPDQRDGPANIFPEIVYDDASAALEWLARAFGFVAGEVIEGADGTIAHAEMHYGAGTIMPKSAVADGAFSLTSPRTLQGLSQCLYVTVEDTDAHYDRAKAAGARIVMEPFDTEYGARNYSAYDLEGHLWSFGTYMPRARTS